MNITFTPLAQVHFSLLIKWLQTPHVKLWWPVTPKLQSSVGEDQDIKWTPELIEEKYSDYVNGGKLVTEREDAFKKPIYAYITCVSDTPIGYIQYYNVHDFSREQCQDLSELPNFCAGLDWYIGEVEFIGKNIGSKALCFFLEQHVFQKFDYVFVDPDTANAGAIRTYEKAGFKKIKEQLGTGEIWMIKSKVNT